MQAEQIEALKPCPHGCGGEGYKHEADFDMIAAIVIGCKKCGALGLRLKEE